jgi:hypothetical protein
MIVNGMKTIFTPFTIFNVIESHNKLNGTVLPGPLHTI